MKLRSKIQTIIFTLAALAVPGTVIASTNLICKADCPFQRTEVKNAAHACCPKISQRNRVTEKLSIKCDNCLESRELPAALNSSTELKQIAPVILHDVTNPGESSSVEIDRAQKFSPIRNCVLHPKSVSIVLHRFLI